MHRANFIAMRTGKRTRGFGYIDGRSQAVVRPRPERGETVRNRAGRELDPLGIRRGPFTVLPGLEL